MLQFQRTRRINTVSWQQTMDKTIETNLYITICNNMTLIHNGYDALVPGMFNKNHEHTSLNHESFQFCENCRNDKDHNALPCGAS